MNEQKQPKPILILSLDTETGGFNPNVNALLTVGVATLKLEDYEDISKIEKQEWKICNSFRVVKKLPEDALWTNSPNYVEEQALVINKIDLKDLELNGKSAYDVDSCLYKHIKELQKSYRIHLLGQNLKFDLGFVSRNLPRTFKLLMSLYTHHELRSFVTAYHVSKKDNSGLLNLINKYTMSTSMDNVRKELNIQSDGQTHSAAVDAEDNIKVFVSILKKLHSIS